VARTLKTRFLGINTDLPPTKLPSGTAREALNVTIKDGKLAKRQGFARYEASVDGGTTSIIGMWVAHFKAATYVVVKLSTGRYYQRKTDQNSFTIISNTYGWTHTNEVGFAFMWNDRFICGDSGGVSQWNPDIGGGVMYKAGLPQPTPALTLVAAANGAKNGFYHCHLAYYHSSLDVEGVVSAPYKGASGPIETRIADNYGGIIFSGNITVPTGYEATHCRVYTTMGNTEYIESGAYARETFSYRATIDVEVPIPTTDPPGMSKADASLDWTDLFTNEGGLPPPARVACWTGGVAVYAGIEKLYIGGDTLTGDMAVYSKFGRPTMVPVPISYAQRPLGSATDDYKAFFPRGGHHLLPNPCDGAVVEAVAAGGTAVLYTNTSTWVMRSTPDGKLYAVKRKEGFGCVGHPAAAAMGFEAHALAHRAWTITTASGFADVSGQRFVEVLEDIPVAYMSSARMAPYSYENEMWCAVVKADEAVARRILVLDGEQLVIYEPAASMWASGEGITAICELAYTGATPTMLVATNKGRILQFPDPSGATGDGPSDGKVDYPANWTGLFATERSAFSQKLEKVEIHSGDECSSRVRWTITPLRSDGETGSSDSGYLPRDNYVNACGLQSKADARFWKIDLSSKPVESPTAITNWSVFDIILQVGRTDLA